MDFGHSIYSYLLGFYEESCRRLDACIDEQSQILGIYNATRALQPNRNKYRSLTNFLRFSSPLISYFLQSFLFAAKLLTAKQI